VVVDLRRDSKTFGRWSSLVLTEDEPKTIFLPIGIAHGFQSLEDTSQVLYGITKKYDPENSSTIRFDDSDLNIDWPMEVKNISEKDLGGSTFSEAVKRFK
jgi:dTDP-4-dehydrorhamnose 3,5-epimerase